MMNREASQSDELSRKNKQEVGGASKPQMDFFFFLFFVFVLFVRVCSPYISLRPFFSNS